MTLRLSACLTLSALLLACAGTSGSAPTPVHNRLAKLQQVNTWAIHLTNYPQRLLPVQAAKFDLVVVDATDDRGQVWPKAEVQAAAQNKLLIAYLSAGAAENYRPYWQSAWRVGNPPWLLREDPDWPGNFDVAYWNADWQAIILKQLDQVIAAGFHGVYLDLIDAYERQPQRSSARAEMVAWVCRIAAYAKARDPEFLIIPQNAAELIRDKGFAACVDAAGQEETFVYAMNQPTEVQRQQQLLSDFKLWKAAKKPVLDIEYADQPSLQASAAAKARAAGLIPYIAGRSLDRLMTDQP